MSNVTNLMDVSKFQHLYKRYFKRQVEVPDIIFNKKPERKLIRTIYNFEMRAYPCKHCFNKQNQRITQDFMVAPWYENHSTILLKKYSIRNSGNNWEPEFWVFKLTALVSLII